MIPIGTNLKRNKLPVATLAIIGVNVIFFIIEMLLPDDVLIWVVQNFGFGPATRNPLALITHMFLHADIYHITFNMLFLWIFGGPVEERTGTKDFLIYYFGAGIAAGMLNLARVYENKLSDAVSAKLHYQSLLELLPQGHPFHNEAIDAIKGLSFPQA